MQVVIAALVIADCISFMPGNPHNGDDPILQVRITLLVNFQSLLHRSACNTRLSAKMILDEMTALVTLGVSSKGACSSLPNSRVDSGGGQQTLPVTLRSQQGP